MAYKKEEESNTPEVLEAGDDFCRLLITKSGDPCESCLAFCPITYSYNNKKEESRISD